MTSILHGATDRRPFAGEGGRTGAEFERATLADGTPVVIKHVSPDGLLARLTGQLDAVHRLWTEGIFDRIPRSIDHTMLAVEPSDDGWVIVMRDASDEFLGETYVLTRDENRRVLRSLTEMHRAFLGEALPEVCSHRQRLGAFTALRATEWGLAPVVHRGWEAFSDVTPRDVSDAMSILLDDPTPLADEFERCTQTFVHGDVRLHNMGLSPARVVLFDWEIAGSGPPAIDFAWYLIISATRIDATRDEVVDDYREIAADLFEPRALELSMIGALLMLGWNKGYDIAEHPDPAHRAQEQADLDWWTARVRRALETWSPV